MNKLINNLALLLISTGGVVHATDQALFSQEESPSAVARSSAADPLAADRLREANKEYRGAVFGLVTATYAPTKEAALAKWREVQSNGHSPDIGHEACQKATFNFVAANALRELGQRDLAVASMSQFISGPNPPPHLLAQAALFFEAAGDLAAADQALELYIDAIGVPDSLPLLAIHLEQNGKGELAKKVWDKYLDVHWRHSPLPLMGAAEHLIRTRRETLAQVALRLLAAPDPRWEIVAWQEIQPAERVRAQATAVAALALLESVEPGVPPSAPDPDLDYRIAARALRGAAHDYNNPLNAKIAVEAWERAQGNDHSAEAKQAYCQGGQPTCYVAAVSLITLGRPDLAVAPMRDFVNAPEPPPHLLSHAVIFLREHGHSDLGPVAGGAAAAVEEGSGGSAAGE